MAQQLPRCVQQASWMRVWSRVGGGGGGMSMRVVSSLTVRQSVIATPIRGLVSPRSQSSLILCRSSSSSSHRVSRSVGGSSGERLRIASQEIGRNLAEGFATSGRGFRASRLPLLSPFLTRNLSSSAEASALVDGYVKESLLKDAEEKSRASLVAAAEEETEKGLLTEVEKLVEDAAGDPVEVLSAVVEKEVDELRERDTLVAEIKSKELELAELRSALRLVEEKHGVEVESNGSDSVSLGAPGFPEVDTLAEQAIASQVSAAIEKSSDRDFGSGIDVPLAAVLSSDGLSHVENEGEDKGLSEETAGAEPIPHPWPEWIQFLKQLEGGGYFVIEEDAVVDLNGSTFDDLGLIKSACMNFARERDDIFLHYSRKDLEVIARFGCPCTDRKVVNAGKRLRDFLAIDEISVCKPCALRPSCERRDFKASADHVSGTPEVIRLLTQYALEVSPYAKEGLQIPSAVQIACQSLIKETIALGAVPRDPSLPKIERRGELAAKGGGKRERESKRKSRDADIEMKPGDWKCEKCQYNNFARNRTCRECDAFRPVPEMRLGDWRCPACDFVNFSRNQVCHDCKIDKPAGAGYKSSYDTGSRYDRGAPQERGGGRFDRDRRSEVRSYDRGSERDSFGRSEPRDFDRGSDRSDRWGGGSDRESFGRSRERGGLERRSGGDEARSGRRSNFEEWKPDLKKRGNFDEDERKDRRSALDIIDDDDDEDDIDDLEFDSEDDEDISDVDALEDEEFEDMRPAASASRRGDTGSRDREVRGRSVGRSEDKDQWWENDRGFRSDRSERGSRGGGGGGRARGGGGRGGRGDYGRDRDRSSSRDSRSSYERSDRDSGRSYGRSDRDSGRPSRGRGGGRGGGRGRGGRGR